MVEWSGGGEGANMWVWVLSARALALRGGQWSRRGAGGKLMKQEERVTRYEACRWKQGVIANRNE